MRKIALLLILVLIAILEAPANAVLVQYNLGVDDYGDLYIDGQLEAHYDGRAQGGDMTSVLDLSPGWHDIEIVIKNRWGSSSVGLYTVTGPNQNIYTVVPRKDLRYSNTQEGLIAEYYTLGGQYVKTINGEGPIHHVRRDSLAKFESAPKR